MVMVTPETDPSLSTAVTEIGTAWKELWYTVVFDGEFQVITGNEFGQFAPEQFNVKVYIFESVVPFEAVAVTVNV
ncbi:hypothetical protein D3C87_1551220 [compost metagenome]